MTLTTDPENKPKDNPLSSIDSLCSKLNSPLNLSMFINSDEFYNEIEIQRKNASEALILAKAEIDRLTSENDAYRIATSSAEALHNNMLRGVIPTLPIRQSLHLHGEAALSTWDSAQINENKLRHLREIAPHSPSISTQKNNLEQDGITLDYVLNILVMAESFLIGKIDHHSLKVVSRGHNLWAITLDEEVLNSDGILEFEPQPSSRTSEFISRTRFPFHEAMIRAKGFLISSQTQNQD